jgi:hypothetical protein
MPDLQRSHVLFSLGVPAHLPVSNSLFKNEFQLESYLLKLTQGERINITKFRCSNIKFPIETGRWAGIFVKTNVG